MTKDKLAVLLDSVNRTIAGICVAEDETTVTIENPVIINAMPKPNGQMGLQLIPVFFREILKDKNQAQQFVYQKANIVTTNIDNLEDQINTEYAMLFRVVPNAPEEATDTKVVDLFEDESKNNG